MTKTLFAKMMIAFIVIIVSTMLMSAFLVSKMIENERIADAEQDMIKTTQEINEIAGLKYGGVISSKQLFSQLVFKAKLEDDIIWLVENNNIWVTSNLDDSTLLTKDLILKYYGDMMDSINNGNTATYISRSSEGPFNAPVITVGAPLVLDNQIVGSVFVHKTLSTVSDSLANVYKLVILSALIMSLFAAVLCYFFSRNMLRPLTHVSNAARELAKGNFDVRVDISSKDEIGELAATFNHVAEDLGKYENTRRSFVANVSHELRSPLTSMQGLVQGVIDGAIKDDQKEYYLNVVLSETKRLNLLINDLLDLARMESGTFPMNIVSTDINELVRRTIITFESKISSSKIDVDIELEDDKNMVFADADRITQVLVNLIDNAVKFTPQGGKLTIKTYGEKGLVYVSVKNTGTPMPKEDIPYVFERFYKADKSRNRETQGTGLGLSIAKRILDQHGQSIWVTSDEVNGTEFVFTLKKSS